MLPYHELQHVFQDLKLCFFYAASWNLRNKNCNLSTLFPYFFWAFPHHDYLNVTYDLGCCNKTYLSLCISVCFYVLGDRQRQGQKRKVFDKRGNSITHSLTFRPRLCLCSQYELWNMSWTFSFQFLFLFCFGVLF